MSDLPNTPKAAALSQTAGVADDSRRMDFLVSKCVEVREPARYGSLAMFRAQDVSDEGEGYRNDLRERIDQAMLAAAPAASGGEVWTREMVADVHRRGEELFRRIHGANPPPAAPSASGGEDGPQHFDGHDHEGFPGGCERFGHSPQNCPSAAPVSERARELLADAWLADTRDAKTAEHIRSGHGLTHVERIALRALEQALTQQRGDGEAGANPVFGEDRFNHRLRAFLAATTPFVDRIVRIFRDRPDDDTSTAVLHDYARECLKRLGDGTEPEAFICQYAGRSGMDMDLVWPDEEGDREDREYVPLFTIPQPSADAVREYDRELIARMLLGPRVFSPESVAEQARLLREADNLEADARTVVRATDDNQQNAAQGGGEM